MVQFATITIKRTVNIGAGSRELGIEPGGGRRWGSGRRFGVGIAMEAVSRVTATTVRINDRDGIYHLFLLLPRCSSLLFCYNHPPASSLAAGNDVPGTYAPGWIARVLFGDHVPRGGSRFTSRAIVDSVMHLCRR